VVGALRDRLTGPNKKFVCAYNKQNVSALESDRNHSITVSLILVVYHILLPIFKFHINSYQIGNERERERERSHETEIKKNVHPPNNNDVKIKIRIEQLCNIYVDCSRTRL
jgi:hypothetical protein